jgi:uncharacterized protein with HEPN domain
MSERVQEALVASLSVLECALDFPIDDRRTLEATDDLQDAVIRCLEVIGEAAKPLSKDCCSKDCRDRHPAVPWRGMTGMRDLLIHAYDQVDMNEVWQAYRQFGWLRESITEVLELDDT